MSRIVFGDGHGGLPKVEIATARCEAEIYLQGACVTRFQKSGESPVLFLSGKSRFEPDAPIRGGIPIVFPWFGKPAGRPAQHGFARNREWTLKEITTVRESVVARLALPSVREPGCEGIAVEYVVSLGDALSAELTVTNHSGNALAFENCLHTYFAVGDISAVTVVGLNGVEYLDSLDGHRRKTETDEEIGFSAEVDRAYVNTPHSVEIRDESLRRIIRVEKANSASTVVWNPWIAKSKAMSDFDDGEYRRMVCVESGNVAENRLTLAPGRSASLKVTLSTKSMELARSGG
jgi:D-hexose-6-phosphate mutarotase